MTPKRFERNAVNAVIQMLNIDYAQLEMRALLMQSLITSSNIVLQPIDTGHISSPPPMRNLKPETGFM